MGLLKQIDDIILAGGKPTNRQNLTQTIEDIVYSEINNPTIPSGNNLEAYIRRRVKSSKKSNKDTTTSVLTEDTTIRKRAYLDLYEPVGVTGGTLIWYADIGYVVVFNPTFIYLPSWIQTFRDGKITYNDPSLSIPPDHDPLIYASFSQEVINRI